MKRATPQKRTPYGKTVRQMLKENPDFMEALAWKTFSPPKLPEQESILDAFSEGWTGPIPALAELVEIWRVSAKEAKATYQSWKRAERQLRKLILMGKRKPSQKDELLQFVRKEFWITGQDQSTGQKIEDLADEIGAIESAGHKVTIEEVRKILSGPFHAPNKVFLTWLVDYWICPVNKSDPPLCLCTDGFLDEIVEEKKAIERRRGNDDSEWHTVPVGESLRKAIDELGLYRPSQPRLGKHWRSRRRRA